MAALPFSITGAITFQASLDLDTTAIRSVLNSATVFSRCSYLLGAVTDSPHRSLVNTLLPIENRQLVQALPVRASGDRNAIFRPYGFNNGGGVVDCSDGGTYALPVILI